MYVWLHFASYLIFLFIRFIIHRFQNQILWYFNGVSSHLKRILRKADDSKKSCQILSIISKKHLGMGYVSVSMKAFIWWHEDFVEPDLLLTDSRWSILAVDEEFVYFGFLLKPWPYYHAKRFICINVIQLNETSKLARMPLQKFADLAEKKLDDPKGPVVHYSVTARSGSTLLTKAVQVSEDKIISFSEPFYLFQSFTTLLKNKSITDELSVGLCKAFIKFYCKEQKPGQTYFIKELFFSPLVIRCMKKAMPRVKHIFSGRKNFQSVCASFEKVIKVFWNYNVMIDIWNLDDGFANSLIEYGCDESELIKRFGMKDILDMVIIYTLAPFHFYYQCRDLFDLPIIYYEDLIERKEETLKEIFRVCELDFEKFGDVALNFFDHDSQSGSIISRDNTKKIKATTFDESRMEKINFMCDELKIPRFEFQT